MNPVSRKLETLQEIQVNANNGDALAQALLADRFDTGQGVRKSRRKAKEWYRRSAERGHVIAKFNLAQILLDEKGNARDCNEALELFTAVWRSRGVDYRLRADAALNIGWIFKNELSATKENFRKARDWYRKAARYGVPESFFNLGLLHLEDQNYRESRRMFELGAAIDHPGSIFELAKLRLSHASCHRDAKEAKALLLRISETHKQAKRLLDSKRLSRLWTSLPAKGTSGMKKPLRDKFDALWKISDSPYYCNIQVGLETIVELDHISDDEQLPVSNIKWQEDGLEFTSLCKETKWKVHNRLLYIDSQALLLIRSGSSSEPTTLRKQ